MSDTENENQVKLLKKIAEVTKAVQYVQKKGSNSMQNYSYVRERDITALVREHVLEKGLLLMTTQKGNTIITEKDVKSKSVTFATVKIEIAIIDIDTGANIEVNFDGTGADYGTGDKAVYKAITGAVKYCLLKAFMIEAGEEDPTPNEPDAETVSLEEWKESNVEACNQIKKLIEAKKLTGNAANLMIVSHEFKTDAINAKIKELQV